MKRKLAMALSLVMLLALALPQSALAVTTYNLEVSITESASSKSVTETSGDLSLNDSLAGVIGQVVGANKSALRVFGSAAMETIVEAGLANNSESAWSAWVDSVDANAANANDAAVAIDLKAKLSDWTTKVETLSVGTAYQISYTPAGDVGAENDPARGNVYTVTLTLKGNIISGGGGGSSSTKPEERVEVKEDAKGETKVSPANPSTGDNVTVSVDPDDGYVISRVIVTDEKGNKIKTSYVGNGKYTFSMPGGKVTITPVLRTETASPSATGVSDLLTVDDHVAFMVGNDKGEFRPNDSVTRAEVAQMFYRLLKNNDVTITKTFSDVEEGAWYNTAVTTLASLGVINGTGTTTFAPDRAITRAEFTAIGVRFAKAAAGTQKFTDVPEDFWAYDYIASAAQYGWIVGDGTGKFNPNAEITRAEAAAIVNRMLGRLSDFDAIDAGKGKSFPDVSSSFWGYYDIAEATSGHDHSFDAEAIHETWQ